MFVKFRQPLGLSVSALALCVATPALAGELQGFVVDSSETVALQAAQISIVELNRTTTAQSDGSYIFGDVPAGTYTVTASYVGAAPVSQTVTVPAEGRVEANFTIGGESDKIIVIGQYANQASALSRQRAADGVVSVLTRDAIGQFPDQNAAESLRRLPGINILDDQGEGRFVSVRGLDPNLNATSLNGVRLPSPESDVRQVALDVISSDIIESITVKKSLTPDMDADTIGASIEINTTSAFDRKKNYYAVRAEGSYNDYSGKLTPKGSFDFSTRLGDNFGVAGGISYYKREFETDNIESDPWATAPDGTAYSPVLELRDYDVKRTRISGSLSFDWRASDTTTAYVRGSWSQFDDHEYRRRTTFDFGEFEDDGPSAVSGDTVTFDGADNDITVERDMKDRFERQRIQSVVVGSDTDTGEWKLNWSASYARSTEREDWSLDPVRFAADFDDGVVIAVDNSGRYYPTYSVTSGAEDVNDPTKYTLNRVELTTLSDSVDEEWAFKGDVARTFAGAAGDFTVQAGGKARLRDKSYNFEMLRYKKSKDYTLADALGDQTYRLIDMGPVASKEDTADWFRANEGDLKIDAYKSALDSAVDDYSVKEDIYAGYALGRWDSDTLRLIGGVRMERTRNTLNGQTVIDDEDNYDLPPVTPVTFKRSYTDWLPSLTMRFNTDPNLIARAAVYKSLVRPKLSAMAPRFNVNEDNEAKVGNPDLLPYRAWNGDFGLDYYFGENAGLSFSAFYKSISNYIVETRYDDYAVNGVTYKEVSTYRNGGSAEVAGFEASYSQAYTMLPAPLDGLLTQLNYTYTYSRGELDDGRVIQLPSNSRHTFNAVIGFDKGPIDLRVAGTYRSKYLDEVGSEASKDRWVDNHFQVDISLKYKVTDNIRLFADWVNVNNAKYFAYQNLESRQRLLQYEEYGPTVKFGARVTF
ncbi:MAG: TonB-dependent receptor [Tsuneonella suprasediminis]|uniref:TonB-dependent receptor n=1 Tax=Tsuneonella suprasediminis TaxID=2306996 RepID=A0A419R691_9SPHN|nr:TonB-dependent receptor [Tsuneonella suprasediminis]RJX71200.1 TonB-dependent receptor [Tsuneonella suprasediminis]UBS34443.1 TonB-dependent receptor [Altererythrobacter sp. N1]